MHSWCWVASRRACWAERSGSRWSGRARGSPRSRCASAFNRAEPPRASSRSRPGTRPTPSRRCPSTGPPVAGRLGGLPPLRAALTPSSPGNVSAFGLLTVDLKNDYVQTFVQRHDRLDYTAVNAHLRRLEALARAALAAEGFADHEIRIGRGADLRYFGQAWEVAVELPAGDVDARSAAVAAERLHQAHE